MSRWVTMPLLFHRIWRYFGSSLLAETHYVSQSHRRKSTCRLVRWHLWTCSVWSLTDPGDHHLNGSPTSATGSWALISRSLGANSGFLGAIFGATVIVPLLWYCLLFLASVLQWVWIKFGDFAVHVHCHSEFIHPWMTIVIMTSKVFNDKTMNQCTENTVFFVTTQESTVKLPRNYPGITPNLGNHIL